MAGPSNIRVNPFTGTGGATNYVELTEKHIIPANSPYVIRLNEVPEKQDPSNMKMVYVDSATGAATENTLTEVAATPGQGEFRPDYSTNAMEDKTWNTGLIEFSASDAGKIVQVTYTGTGTLAGVTSNHWPSWYTDRGDGSDGDFVPTENVTISGVKNYKSVFIKSGITVTVNKYALIKCQGTFVNNGTINAAGKGSTAATDGFSAVGGKGGSGATGGAGKAGGAIDKELKDLFPSQIVWLYGAGGGKGGIFAETTPGAGGKGGGSVYIIANTISNNIINANGENGSDGTYGSGAGTSGYAGGGGGGGGGSIVMIADTIAQGTINVNGGLGGNQSDEKTKGADGGEGIAFIKELGA